MKWKFDKLIENNQVLMIVSLLIALIMWMSIAYGVDQSDAIRTFSDITVSFNVQGSVADRLGLSPLVVDDTEVEVTLMGSRTAMNGLTASDVYITADLSNITQSGLFPVEFKAEDYRHLGFEVVKIEPSSVDVYFDRIVSVQYPVTTILTDINVPEGYILNQELLNPEVVTVTGPSSEVEQIDKVVARVQSTGELRSTTSFAEPLEFVDQYGNTLETNFTITDISEVSVTLPVLKKKEVPVTIGFVNMPSGFNLDSLDYVVVPPVMEIAGPSEMVDSITEIPLGYIDMTELTPDTSIYYGTILPDNIISVDNTNDAMVSFNGAGYDQSEFTVTDIRLLNVPADYDIAVNTAAIYGVQVYGPQEDLEGLNAQNIVAEIDMSKTDVRVGQMVVSVELFMIGEDSCWTYGEYTAVITVKEQTYE